MRIQHVLVHSLGSIWSEKISPDGSSRVWNTTGVFDGRALRSRARRFGQIALGRVAHAEFLAAGSIRPGVWVADAAFRDGQIGQLMLIGRAAQHLEPEWYLMTMTERLIGKIDTGAVDPGSTYVLSHSVWRCREEVLLLARPFVSICGERGTVTLIPECNGCRWQSREWAPQ